MINLLLAIHVEIKEKKHLLNRAEQPLQNKVDG